MTDDLIAELRELSEIQGRPLTVADRARTTIAMSAAADALEAAREDAERLDWMDSNWFSAYRSCDPIDGLAKHCVVVDESKQPRRGKTGTIRAAIDDARKETSPQRAKGSGRPLAGAARAGRDG